METQKHLSPVINFIWSVADDVLVHAYKKGKYGDVILPMTVIRRLDLVLEPTKEKVLKSYNQYKDRLDNLEYILTSEREGSGKQFYNTSKFTLKSLLDDPTNIRINFEDYLDGFSLNVQDIIKKFRFRDQLDVLENDEDDVHLLFQLIEKFTSPKIDLHPDWLSNHQMGYVFEDLVRRFNEENNEEAGEHFTPREIIELMTNLVFKPIKDKLQLGSYLVYDPCSGSGGMLTEARNFINNVIGSDAVVHLYGQEVQPETYATSKADFLIKGDDPEKVGFGSTLTNDKFSDLKFDFMLTNPPYGKAWKDDKKKLSTGPKGKILDPRFQIGIPRVSDGQLMFLQHMLSKVKETPLGSRIVSVHNGSALSTGNAGQGESEIRRHLIENDLLEAVIALPSEMFYNTDIGTYLLVVTNRKATERKGKVQLIDAGSKHFYRFLRKPLGQKRVEFTQTAINEIVSTYLQFKEDDHSKILNNAEFGYRQITIQSPLLSSDGNPILKPDGTPKPDTSKKQIERIPLLADIDAYCERYIKPYYPDTWIDETQTKIGYEIPFTKYFYKFSKLPNSETILDKMSHAHSRSEDLSSLHSIRVADTPLESTGLPWLEKIPQGWEELPLRALYKERKVTNDGKDYNVLSLSYGRIVIKNIEENFGLLPESFDSYQIVEPNNIILRLTDLQNDQKSLRVGLSKLTGIITSAYTCLERKDDRILDDFAYYLLHLYDINKAFYIFGGGLRQSMGYDELKNMPLFVPPKPEQERIVKIANRQREAISSIVDAEKEKILQLSTLRNTLLNDLIVG